MKILRRITSVQMAVVVAVLSGSAGLLTLTALTGPTAAQADPESVTAYVGVGSDVTQDLFDGLSGASQPNSATTQWFLPIHTSTSTDERTIQSFDADPEGGTTLNPGCVTTKLGGPSFDRPNSSTNGIAALLAAVSGSGWENTSATCTGSLVNVTGQIDFARSARGPKTTGTTLTFIPYARDGLGILVYENNTTYPNALATLTEQQLNSIYSSTTGETLINNVEVEGCLTISGSTPRSNLESATGVSDSTANAEATIDGCAQLEQNSGNAFYNFVTGTTNSNPNLPSGVDAIVPISAGNWIGQFNGEGVQNSNEAVSNGLNLADVINSSGTNLGVPYIASGTEELPNTSYYQDTAFGYNLYTVVPTSKLSGFLQDAGLESLFVGSGSALCSASTQATVHQFGFDSLISSEGTCGSTSQTGNG